MFDFRLKVFYVVANRLSFTKAAEELFISQPAVSKHIHEIEVFYKTKIFERNGIKIKLTQAGVLLLKHTEELLNIHRNIDFVLAALSENVKGILKIGASTTIANYVLPKYLASFRQKFPDVTISIISNNTETIENLLVESKIDIALVEGRVKRQYINYIPFAKDEIVLCTSSTNSTLRKETISLKDLQKIPMVLREPGSGSLEVITSALKSVGVSISGINMDIELESTESIKSYLLSSHSFAFLSVHSVLKELKSGELKIVDVKGLDIQRSFCFITQKGDEHRLKEVFVKHLFSDKFSLE